MTDSEYNAQQLNLVLKGATFISAQASADDELVLTFEREIGGAPALFEVYVQADPEGNGPGFIDCQHVVDAIKDAKKR